MTRPAAPPPPDLMERLRTALGEAVNALEWCDLRCRQIVASKPVRDLPELRAYVARTLTESRSLLSDTEASRP